jgi:hypothetical protein
MATEQKPTESSKKTPNKKAPEANVTDATVPAKVDRLFVIKESAVAQLFNSFQEMPYKVANPLIQFLQQNLQEVKPDQVKQEGV